VSIAEAAFELPGGGRALFTERSHGNMSSVAGDGAEHGAQARERLRARIAVERLARGRQVHGCAVRTITALSQDEQLLDEELPADGQASSLAGVATMVLVADCVPVALGSAGAVAMIHAGWRGLAGGVLEQGVRALRELAEGEQIHAVLGPCAGVCCYEVGSEVHAAFAGAHRVGEKIDMRAIARDRLLADGVAEVRSLEACTICDERFFSHRREGERAGRQAGVAWLS
jgi:purine-nucleoside/S-methyl-5'-thioadenosine phosphorylase / adenosine deaminase